MPKRWRIRPHDTAVVTRLEREAKVSAIVARLLAARGVQDPATARTFLAGTLQDLREPDGIPGLPAAAERILAAARSGERVVIYGDYDADGMCATAILHGCLTALGAAPEWYVPDRFEEGYGLNADALRALAAKGIRLVVTVDCGITSVAEARLARDLGLDLVITDHHGFAAEIPDAAIVVHPRLPGGGYPFGDLCGAAVAFKLAWAIATRASGARQVTPRLREMLLRAVGLATLGTVADVMPLVDENRILVKYGLECLRQRGGAGLAHLMELAKVAEKSTLDSEDVAFRIAPRLNAAGRLGQAGLAIEMLTTSDDARGVQLAEWIHGFNEQRDALERSILLAATKQAIHDFDPVADPALVLAGRGWHAGVVGIVAGRLAERYHRPVAVIARDEHQGRPATGSLRSVPGFDLLAALQACRGHLLSCGGHAAAAGLRIDDARIDDFRRDFLAAVATRMPEELRLAQVTIDGEATIASLSLDTVSEIERLAPFGHGNKRPILCATGVRLLEPPRVIGSGGRHLAMTLAQHDTRIRAVAWGGGEWLPHLPQPGQAFHVAFRPKINEFRGRRTAEVELVDWRPDGVDIRVDLPGPAPASSES